MQEFWKTDSNGCSFIDNDAACLPSLPKLILVLQKSKPSKKQRQKSQLWSHICEINAFSLQEEGDLHISYIYNLHYIY